MAAAWAVWLTRGGVAMMLAPFGRRPRYRWRGFAAAVRAMWLAGGGSGDGARALWPAALLPMDVSRVGKEEFLRLTNGPMDLRDISDALGQERRRKRARHSRAAGDSMCRRKFYQSFSEVVHDLRIMFDGALRHIERRRFPMVRRRVQAMNTRHLMSYAGALDYR